MNIITLVGLFAAACTTVSFLPQVIKAFKTKQTKDISFWMYLLMITGVAAWLTYGILTKDMPIIIANSATFILTGMVFALKLKHG